MPRIFSYILLFSTLCACLELPDPDGVFNNPEVPCTELPLPSLSKWEANMIAYGSQVCGRLMDESGPLDPLLAETYYDSAWVFFQIHDYTKEAYWEDCAQAALKTYRDRYVLPNSGNVPGYWNFTQGLRWDYERTGSADSRDAAVLLFRNAAFSRDSTQASETLGFELSRETAYALWAHLNAQKLGEIPRARFVLLTQHALGHLEQWFVSQSASYVRPFMVALTAHALIEVHRYTSDPRIPERLQLAADWLWDHTWNQNAKAFQYTDVGDTAPAPDLNLLISPLYLWVYLQTGEPRYLNQSDAIFDGGVKGAWLGNGKQFNQNYRWSIEQVNWRRDLMCPARPK